MIPKEILKKVRRAIKLEKFEQTFNLMQKYNLYSKIDLIIGLPGEDFNSIESTLEYMMDKLQSSQAHLLCCHIMRGLPGTELNQMALEHNMKFTSEFEPHELLESPVLPRKDMLKCLRRTAVIFRLVNHSGWAKREFLFEKQGKSLVGQDVDATVLVPINFARTLMNVNNQDNAFIMAAARPGVEMEELKDDIRGAMRSLRRLKPKADDDFALNEISVISNGLDMMFSIIGGAGGGGRNDFAQAGGKETTKITESFNNIIKLIK